MISTRGRYALRVMIDLAAHQQDGFIPMKEVAERQGISLKYLEQILPVLSQNSYVKAVHGKGGGYLLTRDPSEIRAGDILRLTEKDLAPVACLSEGADRCEREEICPTLDFWKGYQKVVLDYLDSRTLADFL